MLISRETLTTVCKELKQNGKKVVFTNGCFDILHIGHVTYLEKAARLGDVLVLGLNSDASVSALKGPSRPVNKEADRAGVLSALKFVDYVTVFDEDTPFELVSAIIPDVIVKGGDYTPETIVGADIVTQNGGEVAVIPLVEGKSTTNIIKKINE